MLSNDLPALDPGAEVDDLVQPRSLLLALVRSMTITVPRVFRRISRMPGAEDLKVIEGIRVAYTRVRPGCPDRDLDDPHAGRGGIS
jgi:hypothetical protein